ncbi:MAG: UDPglucose--hexose-1-phosphate uridylyltransferase, partial [Polaribacter sp.]
MLDNLQTHTHKRYNILTGEWVLVSPHRSKRPWQGQEEESSKERRPSYDENCYLCANNIRANGDKNPDYNDVFVFENDFAAIPNTNNPFTLNDGLLKAESEQGICKVICFSPDHSKSIAEMSVQDITKVVKAWKNEFKELAGNEKVNYVQIFENKGAVMGCSNPHPHGQIWSQSTLPNEVSKKDNQQKEYYTTHQKSLLKTYLEEELIKEERIIYTNDEFVVLTPFWAFWPYETMIIPRNAEKDMSTLSSKSAALFADAISAITKAYDQLFNCSFPYSSGIHQAPTNNKNNDHWHWHMSFYPPLLRSATV